MKGKRTATTILALGLTLALMASLGMAQGPPPQDITAPQERVGTAFTYQGRLKNASGLVNGTCDFQFSLWDAAGSGGNLIGIQTKTNVTASEGLFTVELDYGADFWVFAGSAYWLQIAVRCPAGSGTYTTLSPRQPLTPAPYALSLRPGATIHNTATGGSNVGLALSCDDGVGLHVTSANGDGVDVASAGDDGVFVYSADGSGVEIGSAGDDGVFVNQVGSPTTTASSTFKNGFEVAGAQGYGLYVGRADADGVYVNSAAYNGVRVASAGGDGVGVDSASWSGLYVASAGGDGVNVNQAGDDGVYVFKAGNPSTTNPDAEKNGFEVAGAEGYGLYVGRADMVGVAVNTAGSDGVYVNQSGGNGLSVAAAAHNGVFAHTTNASQNYGFYTPDNLYSLNYHLSGAMMLVAQSGESGDLEPGDVVAVSGMGAVFADGEAPVPLVRPAGRGGSILGIVYSRYVAEEEVEEVERDGQVEQRIRFHTTSAEGPITPGDYLLVVVMGAAQVKAEALSGGIVPGDLLTVSAAGLATNAAPAEINGLAYYPPGSILGTAMEPLAAAQGSGLIWVLVNPH